MLSSLTGPAGSDLGSVLGAMVGIFFIVAAVVLVIILLMVICLWKIFTKAGQPGWAALIPIYNTYVLVQVARLPIYYFIILLIPTLLAVAKVQIPAPGDSVVSLVTLVVYIYLLYAMCRQFGKGVGYVLGLIFLPFIFYPMLAFGGSVYQGAASEPEPVTPPVQSDAQPQPQVQEVVQVENTPAPEVKQAVQEVNQPQQNA